MKKYVHGYSERELERLEDQADIYQKYFMVILALLREAIF
jgi:hypothetical protein